MNDEQRAQLTLIAARRPLCTGQRAHARLMVDIDTRRKSRRYRTATGFTLAMVFLALLCLLAVLAEEAGR